MRIPVAAVALALSAGAGAHETEKVAAVPAPAASVKTVTAASMIVVRDKDTGALRAATPEEAEKLVASGRNSLVRAPIAPREIRARAGTRALYLGDAAMSSQVVRRNAQGGLDEVCVEGDEAVARVLAAPTLKVETQ